MPDTTRSEPDCNTCTMPRTSQDNDGSRVIARSDARVSLSILSILGLY